MLSVERYIKSRGLADDLSGRGLHSSTRLNLSGFCGIGVLVALVEGVFRRCQGVFRSIRGCSGCIFVSVTAQVELRSGRV